MRYITRVSLVVGRPYRPFIRDSFQVDSERYGRAPARYQRARPTPKLRHTATTFHCRRFLVPILLIMSQPDGVYPRVNAELLGTGNFQDLIVSVVGRFRGAPTQLLHRYQTDPSVGVTFVCGDGNTIELTGELEEDALPDVGTANDLAVEIIGLAQSPNKVVVGFGCCRWVCES
jgi:hypothetical protein